jgi:hypothetical protein
MAERRRGREANLGMVEKLGGESLSEGDLMMEQLFIFFYFFM